MESKQLLLEGFDILDIAEDFSKYIIDGDNGCYKWIGKTYNGVPFYPFLNKRAKIVAYEILHEIELPAYTRIYNTCGTSNCINPYHFAKINKKNKEQKHRIPKGKQLKKRNIQNELNTRLAYYIYYNPKLYGNIIILPGIKYIEATEPYFNDGIAKQILMCEERLDTFLELKEKLALDSELYSKLRLYSSTADILDVIPIVINKGKWTGFDLDFSGTITENRKIKLHKAIESIIKNQETWWMRITVTVRPMGSIKTRAILNDLLKYLISYSSLYIEDLATGPVYSYCDSAPMQTMQIICKRR
jgi:hypothetical protein